MLKLYEVSALVHNLLESGVDEETGEMSGELLHALAQMRDAGANVGAYVLNLEAEAGAVRDAIAKMTSRKKALENRAQRFRDYLRENMAAAGITRIDALDRSFCARLYQERDEAVEILPGTSLPAHLVRTVIKEEPDKLAIRTAILAGEPVPEGVRIVRRDRLTIA